MAVMSFCAEEIIDRAIEIEVKAKEFYHEAATSAQDATIQSFFEMLTVMEGEHERTFRGIKEHLSEKEREVEINDPGSEMLYYLDGYKEIQAWEGRYASGGAGNAGTSDCTCLTHKFGFRKSKHINVAANKIGDCHEQNRTF